MTTALADPADVLVLCAQARLLHRRALAESRRLAQIVTAGGRCGAGTRLVGRSRRRTGNT